MDRAQMKEQAHGMLDQLSNRQLEAVLGLLRCFTGYDESEDVPIADEGEGLPPANIFGKFFS
jgi:hypothetical protein